MANSSPRDANRIPAIGGSSSADGTFVSPYVDPITRRMYVDADITINNVTYDEAYDIDVNGTYIYKGYVTPGTATSASLWQIIKFTLDANGNPTRKRFANGVTTFSLIWDNRTTYTYAA